MNECRISRLLPRLALIALCLSGLSACTVLGPAVQARAVDPAQDIAHKRGDILTTGQLSATTAQALRVSGLADGPCAVADAPDCLAAVATAPGLEDERRLSSLAELWLQRGMALGANGCGTPMESECFRAWMETARHAYAYLFYTERSPGERAFEDRQTQVRDWYNHAVQRATVAMFAGRECNASGCTLPGTQPWEVLVDVAGVRLPEGAQTVQELLPAAALAFSGLRSTYRRDGFGAELVAVAAEPSPAPPDAVAPALESGEPPSPRQAPGWSEMSSPSITVLARFEGANLAEVLSTQRVRLTVHDPYQQSVVRLHGQLVPLAANFTAGYGVWLARSGFTRQSLRTLLGREGGIQQPQLYLMQPYDPERRVILMLHGLASSPEAWVNLANEILGDEALRERFQVWQMYYPTNMPVPVNHRQIRELLRRAQAHFDPDGQAPASRDMVLIGHSMGGVIARLMVSDTGPDLRKRLVGDVNLSQELQTRLQQDVDPMLRFAPLPGVSRAIFIAAPHRGTSVAAGGLGRLARRLVTLPLSVLQRFDGTLHAMARQQPEAAVPLSMPTSIDSLDENDAFVRAAADLPIRPGLAYHSIIARVRDDGPLQASDDGLVPYVSAHLPGATSERVIISGHSVQETAAAILEIRRILHEDAPAQR